MARPIRGQRLGLRLRLIRHMLRRPDLPMRVRIARPHHRPAIFEDLHMLDPVRRAQFFILSGPCIHHPANLLARHARQGERVVRVVAKHLAQPARGLRP